MGGVQGGVREGDCRKKVNAANAVFISMLANSTRVYNSDKMFHKAIDLSFEREGDDFW